MHFITYCKIIDTSGVIIYSCLEQHSTYLFTPPQPLPLTTPIYPLFNREIGGGSQLFPEGRHPVQCSFKTAAKSSRVIRRICGLPASRVKCGVAPPQVAPMWPAANTEDRRGTRAPPLSEGRRKPPPPFRRPQYLCARKEQRHCPR